MDFHKSFEHPLVVLTRQPMSDDGQRIGFLEFDTACSTPYFICVESVEFLSCRQRREQLAELICDHSRQGFDALLVVVHKSSRPFVFAQLGLADELLRVGALPTQLVLPHRMNPGIVSEIGAVIEHQRATSANGTQVPLVQQVRSFDFPTLSEVVPMRNSSGAA